MRNVLSDMLTLAVLTNVLWRCVSTGAPPNVVITAGMTMQTSSEPETLQTLRQASMESKILESRVMTAEVEMKINEMKRDFLSHSVPVLMSFLAVTNNTTMYEQNQFSPQL